ncbi:MAG TPA: DUF1844 domain-containing protein [Gemmatimonadota bacterium]|nr:DUF1844 domain-containing protein [Gemmatimonadota bacterium]
MDDSGRSRFREGRSAFRDETAEETAPAETIHAADAPAPEAPPERPAPEPPEPPRAPEPPIVGPTDTEPAPGDPDLAALESFDLPEPSFLEVVEILATQALQFLGEAPITERGDRAVFPRHAKHVIDLLGILEERTRGNLPEEERDYLVALLDELRTRYLRVAP